MSTDVFLYKAKQMPGSRDVKMARDAIKRMSALAAEPSHAEYNVNVGGIASIQIPAAAYGLLVEILEQMAQGNAVALMPPQIELTSQQAADYLNVSRPFLVKLLGESKIPYRKVGAHRRVRFEDVLRYKQQVDAERSRVLDELTREAQDMGLGY